jgi:hypothetical protein
MIEPVAVSLIPATPAFPERPVLVVVPPLPAAEAPLFQERGVLVTAEQVVARGRSLSLAEVLRVESVRHSPRMAPVLATLGFAMSVGLPALSGVAGRGLGEAALVALAVVLFGCIARLLTAEDAYEVVVHTEAGAWSVLSSREAQASTKLAGLLQEAAGVARRRR